jgi:hypothetical protein
MLSGFFLFFIYSRRCVINFEFLICPKTLKINYLDFRKNKFTKQALQQEGEGQKEGMKGRRMSTFEILCTHV